MAPQQGCSLLVFSDASPLASRRHEVPYLTTFSYLWDLTYGYLAVSYDIKRDRAKPEEAGQSD